MKEVVSIGGIANDGVNYYMKLILPDAQPGWSVETTPRPGKPPLVTRVSPLALQMQLQVTIRPYDDIHDDAVIKPLREALLAALDTSEAAVALEVSDPGGANERYLYVVTQAPDEEEDGIGAAYTFTLLTYDETRWRANTPHEETWEVAASSETRAVTNAGSLPARPVYTIRPTDAKVGAGARYKYRRWVGVKWSGGSYTRFPVELTNYGIGGGGWDTAALVGSFDLLAETNIGVVVDGEEKRRWIVNYNHAQTRVWVNLDFLPAQTTRLLVSIGSGDTVTEIAAALDITGFPVSGILQIGDEVFTYADKDDTLKKFLGVTRAAKGSSAAAHDGEAISGDVIYWIQHDIWLVYGPQGVRRNTFDDSAPDTYWYVGYDGYKPTLDLDESWNQNWYFNSFGQSGNEHKYHGLTWRPGGAVGGTVTIGEPWDNIALLRDSNSDPSSAVGPSSWALPLSGTVLQVQVYGRAAKYEYTGSWQLGVLLSGVPFFSIPEPVPEGGSSAFVDFQETGTRPTGSGARAEEIRVEQRSTLAMEAQIDRVQIYYDDHFTYDGFTTYSYPEAAMGPAEEMYDLALTLENVTTGQSITLTLPMLVDEQLEVDTEEHTVTLLDDGSSQYQALSRNARRLEMLPLRPGVNTLKVTETGLAGVTIYIAFEERTYS